MANGAAHAAPLLCPLESEAIDDCHLLHAIGPGILKLRGLWVQQRRNQLLCFNDLVFRVSLDVHVLWHLQLLVGLPLVPYVLATDEDPAACDFLKPFVVDAPCTDDHTHEGGVRPFLVGDDDLLYQPLRFPPIWWLVALDRLHHVPNEPVILGNHCLLYPGLSGIEPISLAIVQWWWRGRSDVRIDILQLTHLDFPMQVFQPLLAQELVNLVFIESYR
mmetsp:Transcript_59100/g.106220  ORF Transcript_59100/g.106220 Transcript_59100/m.106220 type:complete len:218 (+) Transcript_59100:405-1058(+)